MKIDNINNYLNNIEDFEKIASRIYKISEHLNDMYPNYKKWFYKIHLTGCRQNKRNIIFITDELNKIIAISCLKKDDEEKKICTFLVLEKYREQGIGNLLLEESLKYLGTPKPLITFTEDKLPMFKKIIEKYEWELIDIADGIYLEKTKELCFNGKLSKDKTTF